LHRHGQAFKYFYSCVFGDILPAAVKAAAGFGASAAVLLMVSCL
jgi:hypothetical protein